LTAQEQVLWRLARGESRPWPGFTAEQARAVFHKAERYLARCQANHMPHGLVADLWWRDFERGAVDRLEGIGDSAAWTGHYLAALALKYAATKEAGPLEDIQATLDKFEVLITISGRDGYVTRYAGPAGSEPYRGYYSVYGKGEDPARPGLGKRAYRGIEPYTDLVWLGWSSRDTYDGTIFGLATAWKYVDDPAVRDRVAGLAAHIADRLIEDDWGIIDGKGGVTRSTPTFQLAQMRAFLTICPERFGGLQRDYDALFERVAAPGRELRMRSKYDQTYFPANLNYIRYFVLCALEEDAEKLARLRAMVARVYREQCHDHLNAHFAAIYMAATDNADDNDARAALEGMLLLFPDEKWLRSPDRRNDPAVEKHNDAMARYALFPRDRRPHDFLWQRSPCELSPAFDTPIEFPGIDVFLPYWMGRAVGAIPAP